MRTFARLGVVVLTLLGSGCAGTATVVRRGEWSGELALSGSPAEAWYAAEDRMLEHCGGRSRVLATGEAARLREEDASEVRSAEGELMVYTCVRSTVGER